MDRLACLEMKRVVGIVRTRAKSGNLYSDVGGRQVSGLQCEKRRVGWRVGCATGQEKKCGEKRRVALDGEPGQ